jgi:hypothetical protein
MMRGLAGERGMFTADQVRGAIHSPSWRHAPRSRLLEVAQVSSVQEVEVAVREDDPDPLPA